MRITTRFRGAGVEAVHDTASGEARAPATGEREPCGLAEFLRAVNAERGIHKAEGLPYAVTQEIEGGDGA